MRTTKKVITSVENDVVEKIICNKCGKDLNYSFHECYSGSHVWIVSGYGSRHDGTDMDFDLCCDCVDELLRSLLHKADVDAVIF
jgi:hypothetical protein